ncbi:MAG: HAD family phosphatase [Bacteroidales bacterium]|nr:HAD family phosphatase [Bacteroidales bacterium]
MFKAFFFDMDGVLYDSMPNHEYTWTHSFAAYGITFPAELAYINEGRTGRGTINLVMNKEYNRDATEEEIESIYGLKTELMRKCPKAPVMPGMQELIKSLRSQGILTFVVTGSKQPSLIDKLSADFGFTKEYVVSGADVKKGKPDPEPYLIALQRSGLMAEECAVVENAPLGVRAAKGAGLFCYGVNTGKLADHYLTDEGVDQLYHSTAELSSSLLSCR